MGTTFYGLDDIRRIVDEQRSWGETAIADARAALDALKSVGYQYTMYGNISEKEMHTVSLLPPTTPGELTIEDAPDVSYTYDEPTPPTPLDMTGKIPTEVPEVDWSNIRTPETPSLTWPNATMNTPAMGTLYGYTPPTNAPVINFPNISLTPPGDLDLTITYPSFSVEPITILDDPLVEIIRSRLTDNIRYGGTGLLPDIEDAIWNRDLERNEQQLEDSTDQIIQTWAKKGITLPDGMLANSISESQREYMNRRIDRSREISIKQAELEQTNLFKSMELGINLFGTVVKALSDYNQLMLQSQEYTAKYTAEYINLQIQAHNHLVDVYKAKVQTYEVQVRAELAKVEIYKAEIEAALGNLKADQLTTEIYRTQVMAAIEEYKGHLDADKLIVEIFSEETKAAIAQAGLEESKVRVYAEQVRAAMSYVEIYKAQVEAYVAELGGEKAKIESNIAVVDIWRKKVDASIAAYNVKIEEYRANTQFNIGAAQTSITKNEAELRSWAEALRANLEYTKLEEQSIKSKAELELEAAKGVAIVASNMASGALASLNANASMAFTQALTGSAT